MTDHDTLDDAWAGHAFDRARAPHDEPHWLPDVAGAVRLSNRRRRRTRFTTAAAVVVVVGLAASDYIALGGGDGGRAGAEPGSPASSGTPHHSPTPAPHHIPPPAMSQPSVSLSAVSPPSAPPAPPQSAQDKTLAAELSKTMAVFPGPDLPVPRASAQALTHLVKALDPTGAHLRQAGRPQDLQSRVIGTAPNGSDSGSLQAYSMWTPDGDGEKPYSGSPDLSAAYGELAIQTFPAMAKPDPMTPCQSWIYGLSIDDKVDWAPCQDRHLKDGSELITTHSTSLGDRRITVGVRKFPDGSLLNVSLVNWVQYATANHDYPDSVLLPHRGGFLQSKAIQPVPWTDEQLADALSSVDTGF